MKYQPRTRDSNGVPRCPDTNKIQHRSEKSTNEDIARQHVKGLVADGVSLRAYQCPWCGWWHETSKTKQPAWKKRQKTYKSTAEVIAASDSFRTPITPEQTFEITVRRAA